MPNNRWGLERATSGADWRESRKIGSLVALPSGNTAYIRHTVLENIALGAIDNLCKAALVYPRIVDDPKDADEIAIADLSLSDKLVILSALLEAG